LDHSFLVTTLEQIEIAQTNEEGQTAIGDAIALGVEKLRALSRKQKHLQTNNIKSKIIILLTDGESNAGDIEPLKAAEIAKTYGIKVYTIGAGTKGMAPMPVVDFFGNTQLRPMKVNMDEKTLTEIADMTGGKYYRATDTDSLHKIYADIDKLEKSKTEEKRFLQYKEMATQSVRLGPLRVPPLLFLVFALLTLEIVLINTRFRKIP